MKNLTRTTAWLLVSVLSVSAAAVHASDWDYKYVAFVPNEATSDVLNGLKTTYSGV